MQQQQNIQPAFEVEILDGTEKVTRSYFDDGMFKQEEVEVNRGWNVYFPAGHSIRIRDESEMRRLGFNDAPNLMDMEGDSENVITPATSLKAQSHRKTRKSRKNSASGGVMKDG